MIKGEEDEDFVKSLQEHIAEYRKAIETHQEELKFVKEKYEEEKLRLKEKNEFAENFKATLAEIHEASVETNI